MVLARQSPERLLPMVLKYLFITFAKRLILQLIAKIIPMHRNQDCPSFSNSNKSYVSLTIEDDGMGMDEETRSKIFDPV